ncbi:hypothetical protein, partial [Acidianus sp. RZ1]|uniref:hypothetical protein n=1 Tax=Acidianus sp. RZ1 TaxID=1540082 RepID=UPI001C1107AB
KKLPFLVVRHDNFMKLFRIAEQVKIFVVSKEIFMTILTLTTCTIQRCGIIHRSSRRCSRSLNHTGGSFAILEGMGKEKVLEGLKYAEQPKVL